MFANRLLLSSVPYRLGGECRGGARWRLFGANRKVVEHPWTVTKDPRIQEESGLLLSEVEHGDPLHHG